MKNRNKNKNNTKLKFVTEKADKKRKVAAFTTALISFLLVFGAVSAFLLMRSSDYSFSKFIGSPDAEEETQREPQDVVPDMPDLSGSANILFLGTGEKGIEYAVIIHCDVAGEKISVYPVDSNMKAVVDGKSDTLSGHYFYAGFNQLTKAVEEGCSVKIDRYVAVTRRGMQDLAKELGGIEVDMKEPLAYKGEDFSLNLKAGKQTISGDTFYKLLMYPASGKSAQLQNRGEAFCFLIDSVLTLDNILEGDEFFSSLINCTKSDISVEDYLSSERILERFVKSEGRKPNEVAADISYIQ